MMDWVGRALALTDHAESTANTANSPTPIGSIGSEIAEVPSALLHPIGSIGSENAAIPFDDGSTVEAESEAAALVDEGRAAGLILTVEVDGLRVRHRTNAAPDEALLERLTDNKAAVIVELKRQADVLAHAEERGVIDAEPAPVKRKLPKAPALSNRGMMCLRCHRVALVRELDQVCSECIAAEEWRIEGCPGFTVLATAGVEAERRYGACLRCGASWPLHGSPESSMWTRVTSLDDVANAEVRFVVARAREIARGRA